jgi:peptidoglycan/LPS O-acetylase OafA/YrhL
MNQPSAFWNWLNRRAYAVYIIHPPVLVGIALLLHSWAAPALVKFGVVGSAGLRGTWLLPIRWCVCPACGVWCNSHVYSRSNTRTLCGLF